MNSHDSPQDDLGKMIERYKNDLIRCKKCARVQCAPADVPYPCTEVPVPVPLPAAPPAAPPVELRLPTDRNAPCEAPIPWTPATNGGRTLHAGAERPQPPAEGCKPSADPPAPAGSATAPPDAAAEPPDAAAAPRTAPDEWAEPRCHAFPPFSPSSMRIESQRTPPAPCGEADAGAEPPGKPDIEKIRVPPEPISAGNAPILPLLPEAIHRPAAFPKPGPPDPPAPAASDEARRPQAEISPGGARAKSAIRVSATTGRGSSPVSGAHVTISQTDASGAQTLYALALTGPDGLTAAFTVPALPAALSLKPGNAHPYLSYHVRVDKPGFFTFHARGVPVYEGVLALQNADLVPLPENFTQSRSEQIIETGPQAL